MSIQLLKKDERGRVYQCNGFKLFYRIKNSVSGNNDTNLEEKIYVITGTIEVTRNAETKIINAPEYTEIPANTYHKITAVTDTSFIVLDNKK
ncbi:MAG: hypothetical protein CR972_01295 [Candidatus Moraniibacteriota bacterium]|nr:MAG: hypothetical protein CR972_01295 [Candidatus Moranbacteria bacterium]